MAYSASVLERRVELSPSKNKPEGSSPLILLNWSVITLLVTYLNHIFSSLNTCFSSKSTRMSSFEVKSLNNY